MLRLSRLHTAGGRNASWTLPLGVARTVCFESANQLVLNKAPIIIIYALHFLEFLSLIALRINAQSSYDIWTLSPESQQFDVCLQKQNQV